MLAEDALTQAEPVLGEDDDRASLRCLVRERRELGDLCELALLDAVHRQELGRLAIAEGDRARLVEQQHVDVARCLDSTTRHREHVPLHEPVHAGDPDRGEQCADRRRDQRHEQGDQHGLRGRGPGVERVWPKGRHGRDEGDRQAGEQDIQRDLVGRLATFCTLDERDHAIEEGLAGLLRDLDHEPVGEQLRATRDRRAIAA